MNNGPFWLRGMIVMGQGAPNAIRKLGGQQGRCLCLWSKELGYCRVYPVPYGYVHDWEIVDVEVKMSESDGRENSFSVFNYEAEWNNLSKRIYVHREKNRLGTINHTQLARNDQIKLVRDLAKDTFSGIRDNKKSFGLIKPSSLKLFLERNLDKSEAQLRLDGTFDVGNLDNLIMDQNDYAWRPYLKYSCEGSCKSRHPHKQKIVSWEAYQFMKKNPNSQEHCKKLIDNYHVNDENYEHYVLIGNIKQYPTTYIVVKLIRFKKK